MNLFAWKPAHLTSGHIPSLNLNNTSFIGGSYDISFADNLVIQISIGLCDYGELDNIWITWITYG